jgi:hypothetical protein
MRAPLRPSANNKGAVLLHTLMLLMVATSLIMIVIAVSRRNVGQVAAFEDKTRTEILVEASVETIVRDLMEHGQRSEWLNPPGHRRRIAVDGAEVEASVTDVRGLVDINDSNLALIERLLSSQLGNESGRQALERLRERRANAVGRLGTYVDMAAALGLSIEQLACLQPDVTLFSMLDQPDSRYSPDALKELLRLEGSERKDSVISEEAKAYGQTYQIAVSTSGPSNPSVDIVAELFLTGKEERPYILRSWMWFPHGNGNTHCGLSHVPVQ